MSAKIVLKLYDRKATRVRSPTVYVCYMLLDYLIRYIVNFMDVNLVFIEEIIDIAA
jgi:hypothetical protein